MHENLTTVNRFDHRFLEKTISTLKHERKVPTYLFFSLNKLPMYAILGLKT
jgi:hypothetical protein